MKKLELDEIVKVCIKSAIDYGVAAYEVVVNSKKTNKLYDKQYNNFRRLKNHENGVEALFELLEHPNLYVKYTAAIYLLSVDEKKPEM